MLHFSQVSAWCGSDHPRTRYWELEQERTQANLVKKIKVCDEIFRVVIYDEGTQKVCQPSRSSHEQRQSISISGKKQESISQGKFAQDTSFVIQALPGTPSSSCDQVSQDPQRVFSLFPKSLWYSSSCSENKPTESTRAIFTSSERLSILEIAAGNSDIW